MADDDNITWRPTATLENLRARSELLWQIRALFHEHGFLEVHTPLLSRDSVLDRHIDPIVVQGRAVGVSELSDDVFYLQTSPEFAMKRLMAAGATQIYQITPAFRSGERGQYHNPEFTMLEWYRFGDDFEQAIEFLQQVVRCVMPGSQPVIMTYQQAFLSYADVCPLSCDLEQLRQAAAKRRLPIAGDWGEDRDEWLNLLFAEVIQPRLGLEQPVIVTHYPASQSALAQICPEDPRVAERFELFIQGVELANGYHELLDANQLSHRNQITSIQRKRDGKLLPKQESRLLEAMRFGMPACSGCALGFDRLLMVLSGADRIDQVICFPIERA